MNNNNYEKFIRIFEPRKLFVIDNVMYHISVMTTKSLHYINKHNITAILTNRGSFHQEGKLEPQECKLTEFPEIN